MNHRKLDCLTRHHLSGWGLTPYQIVRLTQNCPVKERLGRQNQYAVTDLLKSAQQYEQQLRIRTTTRLLLKNLITQLQSLKGTVISLPFGEPPTPVSKAIRHLLRSQSTPAIHQLRAIELQHRQHYV